MSQQEPKTFHPLRITRLSLEGFKSYGSPPQALELGPLNVFVGANASGKSNLLSALRFLKLAVTQNADYAAEELGGLDEVFNKLLSQQEMQFTLGLELDCGGMVVVGLKGQVARLGRFHYVVRIRRRGADAHATVVDEQIDGEISADSSSSSEHYSLLRDQKHLTVIDPVFSPDRIQEFPVQDQDASRLALGIGFFSAPCVVLRTSIERWQFYDLNPRIARLPYRETGDAVLGPQGENLSLVLHQLRGKNGELDAVTGGLRGVVAGFQDVRADLVDLERKRGFRIIEEGIPEGLGPEAASDGTIRLLALMVIANQQEADPSIVGIEELENGLHPWLLEHLVHTLREASQRRQFLITTHNPAILDWMEPHEIFLCDKEDGFTRIHRASTVEQVDTFRHHFSLGDLWTQGVLGGTL